MDLAHRVVARYAASKTADVGVGGTLDVGETYENEDWRVFRGGSTIRITHLENAGRKGKKCVEIVVIGDQGMESLAMEFYMHAKKKSSIARMEQAAKEARTMGVDIDQREVRGVDVKPGNFQKLFIRGALVTITADYANYQIQDITDDDNEPTCLAVGKKSPGQFYRWVKDNMKKVQSMSIHDIMEALKAQGIQYHYYCAVD